METQEQAAQDSVKARPIVVHSDDSIQSAQQGPGFGLKRIIASFVVVFLLGGIGLGVYLTQKPQQLQSQASNETASPPPAPIARKSPLPVNPSVLIATSSSQSAARNVNIPLPPPVFASSGASVASKSATIFDPKYDFNKDGKVDSADLNIIKTAWGKPKNAQEMSADLNNDGTINGVDLSLFLSHYNNNL